MLVLFRKKLKHSEAEKKQELKSRRFMERFGLLTNHFEQNGIYIHCASVGEINAVHHLIVNLQKQHPEKAITLSTSSVTGAVHAARLYQNKVQHCYLPFDVPLCMQLFFNHIKPCLCLIVELEIWPNMLHQCQSRNIPCLLINARMTDQSLVVYKKFAWLFRPSMRSIEVICTQSTESFSNFLSLGVYKKQLVNTKNMKFDISAVVSDADLGEKILDSYGLQGRPILLGGSTHAPEEKALLKTFTKLKQQVPTLCLIIVPRHPHRFDEVENILRSGGLCVERISKNKQFNADENSHKQVNKEQAKEHSIDCVLVDIMGCLKACYSICDVSFVGGSLAPKGGHNALEAALYSKPIVMGPSTYNNPKICEYLENEGALVIVNNEAQLYEQCNAWISDNKSAEDAGKQGVKVLRANAGAVQSTLHIIDKLLATKA
ncbi:3-deoxy-D-manno-octulosonic acid transferase [Glaciecola petra]|uniref:3-deoxy-D-manno-octulosonic acid transferase n=1 Tax=Glaciecola petra TaxID=3075602 RepID=A0ABU2ZW15_9ALTE|nr:3-deoxy-D-manno-octulosonic acid transferase [Aestuariibacter sp. P117]MDT0595612.1 3-deoxy-D-manno-octulosonic acid transferase [Aestuariibacter sp. P117]